MWLGAILVLQQQALSASLVFHSMTAGEYTHYTKSLKREWRSSFRKRPNSIHVFIVSDTCCSTASRHSDWEAVGTSRDTRTHTDTMEYESTKH